MVCRGGGRECTGCMRCEDSNGILFRNDIINGIVFYFSERDENFVVDEVFL